MSASDRTASDRTQSDLATFPRMVSLGWKKLSSENLSSQYSSRHDASSPPPCYEANAYPTVRPRRLRKVFSVPVGLALGLTIAISWLCFLLERETAHLRSAAQHGSSSSSPAELKRFQASVAQCAALRKFPARIEPSARKTNPRWNSVTGQAGTVVLRNATLFDGEEIQEQPVDIVFEKGIIVSVSETDASTGNSKPRLWAEDAKEINLYGAYVTPGLVDMHSHHLVSPWPSLEGDGDGNEIHPDSGPLTPFVRALDGMTGYDVATTMIASGGVTSSLIIPGSANIMGGEGTVVKNRARAGPNKEFVVEEMLLEHGVPVEERHRYMKMACGENPKRIYGHTRMGNAWVLRKHLARAKALMEKQDAWCEGAEKLRGKGVAERRRFVSAMGSYPNELELESTVGMLRGRVAMHNHCYMPNDFETMLRISHEFGFQVRAFHHAISAWLVPKMLKEYGDNVTIATFAEASLYKVEAYQASLYAGQILSDHGVPVAYKSDHSGDSTNAKYLIQQAASGFYFGLNYHKALQAVTSVPAKAIDLDYRIGYVRPGYDADIVIWDAMPLGIGSTPRQVYIDGVETLDPAKVEESMGPASETKPPGEEQLAVRITVPKEKKAEFCNKAKKPDQRFVISGIQKSFLENYPELKMSIVDDGKTNLTLVLDDGTITCLDAQRNCQQAISALGDGIVHMNLKHGYLAPGLTAISDALGISEILMEDATGNGAISPFLSPKNPANVDYAKYGVNLEGKAFGRARLGGVTRAITAPLTGGGLLRGVSVGILTGGKRNLLDGGIFQPDVALHVTLGEANKVSPGSMSMAVQSLRAILKENTGKGNESVYGMVATGFLPLVVWAESKSDTQQVVLLKKEFPNIKAIIQGGQGAPFVAEDLAKAKIPVILNHRAGPASWSAKDVLIGPPLTRSPASILSEAGVLYTVTASGEPPSGDSRIHDLGMEAVWAAKYAGLSERETIRLVSRNVEDILGLKRSKDIVLWEGSALAYGTPVLAFQDGGGDGRLELASCWPDEGDE